MQSIILAIGLFIILIQVGIGMLLWWIYTKLVFILDVMQYLDDAAKQEAEQEADDSSPLTISMGFN